MGLSLARAAPPLRGRRLTFPSRSAAICRCKRAGRWARRWAGPPEVVVSRRGGQAVRDRPVTGVGRFVRPKRPGDQSPLGLGVAADPRRRGRIMNHPGGPAGSPVSLIDRRAIKLGRSVGAPELVRATRLKAPGLVFQSGRRSLSCHSRRAERRFRAWEPRAEASGNSVKHNNVTAGRSAVGGTRRSWRARPWPSRSTCRPSPRS